MKSKRSKSLVISFVLFIALSLLITKLEAYQPLISIGKPSLWDILYSPDGRFLATLTTSYVELLDAETMDPMIRIDTNAKYSYHLAFSPDSSLLAVSKSNDIQIWHIPSRTLSATIPVETMVTEFSPDGKYLAYSDKGSVFLWDIEQKMVVKELKDDTQSRLYAIAFHPNGKVLAVGSNSPTIALLDMETGNTISYLKIDYDANPETIKFSHDGNLLVAIVSTISADKSVKLWNLATGDSRFVGSSCSNDVAFTPDDQLLLIGEGNGELRIVHLGTFESETRPAIDPLPPPNIGNANRLESLTIRPDGKRLANMFNYSKINVWDTKDFSLLKTFYGWGQSSAQAVYLPKANRIVTGKWTNELYFWDATTGELLKTVEFNIDIRNLTASPDGIRFAISRGIDGLEIWDASSMKRLLAFDQGVAARSIEFSPSGKYFAVNDVGGIIVWDANTGKEISPGYYSNDYLSMYPTLLFTSDEKQVITLPRDQQKTLFWDIETGKIVNETSFTGPLVNIGDDFIQARYITDGIEIFLLKSNMRLCKIPLELQPQYQDAFLSMIKFHPSGNMIIVDYDYMYREDDQWKKEIYNTWTGKLIVTLHDIFDLSFTNDGSYMFMVNGKDGLGLYRTDDVLGGPVPTAVNPSGIAIATWGRVKQNKLLQNYPNPFNPETWIPYQLGEDANVVIKIYSSSGQLVRTINIGLKIAGLYFDKEKAVYWDGRDNSGEKVVSGIYFYTIETNKFTDTKKMVIMR